MSKKVLHFIGSFHQGGSERQALQLARFMHADNDFAVSVATLEKRGILLEEAEEAGFGEIQEYRINSFLSFGFVRKVAKCASFLKENKIDIVHTHDFYTNVFGMLASRLAGVQVRIASKRETKGVRTPAQERLERFVYRFSNAITVNSEAVKRHVIAKGVESEKISVVHNGLDFDQIQPKMNDRNKISDILDLPRDKRLVTLVANMRHSVKNQPMLLRTAQRLNNDYPDVHFVFAGEGERKDFLTELAGKLGVEHSVHFIDRCRIVPELLSISTVCVLTSYAEGFSNSILEYMAAGKPVVATNVGGAAECVIDGETGYLVDSDDDEAMAERLALILNDPVKAKEFGDSAKKAAIEKFSVEKQLASVKEIYNGLLSK